MAGKKNGNGKSGDPVPDLLTQILEHLRSSESANEKRFLGLEERLQSLERATVEGFASVNGRLDNILVITGGHHRELDARLKAVEADVAALKAPR